MSIIQSAPHVGLNTDFIRDQPIVVNIETGFTGGIRVSLGDGTPLLTVDKDFMSISHRMHFVDARTDQKLFEMRKEGIRFKYYAEHPDKSGRNLFDIDIDGGFMGGPTAYMNFANVVNGGAPTRFEYKDHTFESNNMILWDGQPIAEVESHTMSRHITVRLAGGIDPLPVIAMVVAMEDRAKTKRQRSAN